ncbi:MAG: MarR family transcriptional regulator [Clostridiales bacterium]|nr:MarR family transcriptional regulator [Clostridiales bacterium]
MSEKNKNAYGTLNYLLVDLFNDILAIEENVLKKGQFSDLSMRDFHIIEQMVRLGRTNMSVLAKKVRVTKGTLTVAIDHLVRKGYVIRDRKTTDRRMVEVWLTERAEKAETIHAKFHDDMINEVMSALDKDELVVLESALGKVNRYFQDKYDIPVPK